MGLGDQNQSSIFDDNKPTQQVLHSVIVRALMILLPLVALVVGVVAVVYFNQTSTQMTMIQQRELNTVDLQKKYIIADIAMISSDLFYLSQMRMLGEFLETKGTISAKHITDLAEDFLHLSNSRKIYDQIRLLDENGMEIVRVNFNEGNPSVVSDDKLQNKAKRYYFSDTFILDKGQIFVSPLDLNIEQGQIEKPKASATLSKDTVFDNIWVKVKQGEYAKPMMRFGTPVFDRQGQKRGIILLNYFGANLLGKINILSNSRNSKSMLLNSEGYWLKGQSPEDEWGFMYKNGKELTFGKVYPKAWQQIQSRQKGQFKTSHGLFTFSTVYPFFEGQILNSGSDDAFAASIVNLDTKEYNWKVVSHIPTETLYSARNTLLVKICAVSGLLITLFAIGSLRLAWYITERKQAEKKLENLAKFPSENPNPVLRVTKDGEVLYSNKAGKSLLVKWKSKVGEIVPEKWNNLIAEAFASKKGVEEEVVEVKDRVFSIAITPVKEAGYANLYGRDITEMKKAQEVLRVSEERFRRAVLESPFPIMIHAEDGEIFQISKVWTELTGYTPQEIPTLSAWTERAYGELKDIVKGRIDKIFAYDTRVEEGEYVISSKDGKMLIWDFRTGTLPGFLSVSRPACVR